MNRRELLFNIGVMSGLSGCNMKRADQASTASDIQKVVDSLLPWRTQHERPAYKPVTRSRPTANEISHFGGVPLVGPKVEWPICGRCSNKMSLLIQLDLMSLPLTHPHLNSGILQVFYCTYTNTRTREYCDDYQPFSECHRLRIVDNAGLSEFGDDIPTNAFPASYIEGWSQFTDLPAVAEHDRLGLFYDVDYENGVPRIDVHWIEGGIHHTGIVIADSEIDLPSMISSAAPKDKLLGWPCWIQGVEYPSCPECKEEMTYFFQIASVDHIPHMFGDVGCGHVSYCAQHPQILAFTWACS